jgi:branched-chain amino acid aminotransferase
LIKPEVIKIGTSASIVDTVKRIPNECLEPQVKNYHWGDFTAGLFEVKDSGYDGDISRSKWERY